MLKWMPPEVLFILALHSIAAVISLIVATRDGLGFLQSLRWFALGFLTGFLGLITRARIDRRHLHYMQVVQDTVLNLGMEVVALYIIPHFLK
jgi:hypothetical protein